MQALIFLALVTAVTWAKAPVAELTVVTQLKYSQRVTRILSDKGKFKCDTENQPAFLLKENPLKGLVPPAQKAVTKKAGCENRTTIVQGKTTVSGCQEDPVLAAYVAKVDALCRLF